MEKKVKKKSIKDNPEKNIFKDGIEKNN